MEEDRRERKDLKEGGEQRRRARGAEAVAMGGRVVNAIQILRLGDVKRLLEYVFGAFFWARKSSNSSTANRQIRPARKCPATQRHDGSQHQGPIQNTNKSSRPSKPVTLVNPESARKMSGSRTKNKNELPMQILTLWDPCFGNECCLIGKGVQAGVANYITWSAQSLLNQGLSHIF